MGNERGRNEEAYQELRSALDRIGKVWPESTSEILKQRNPSLLAELDRLEGVMDSLLAIPSKWPSPIKKQWREAIASYEKNAMLCITYAKRHMPSEANT